MNDYKLKKAIDMAVDYCKNNGDTIVQIPFHDWDNTIVSAYWETVNTGEGPCDIIIVKIKRDSIGEEYKLILDTLCKDRIQYIWQQKGEIKMLKTKIAITQWIKKNFKSQQDFEEFLEYDYLNGFVQDGRKLLPQYQAEYDILKPKWQTLHNTINNLPEIEIWERFGRETHKTMITPLNYMSSFYYSDCTKREKLFKKEF